MFQKKQLGFSLLVMLSIVFGHNSFGQAVEINEEKSIQRPKVGADAAREYFKARQKSESNTKNEVPQPIEAQRFPSSWGGRVMTLHAGAFVSEDIYKWGNGRKKSPASWDLGMTYKLGEWAGSMDYFLRAFLTQFDLYEGRATKLSLMPSIILPDIKSRFPLYFGISAGAGIFFKQIADESSLSLDYSLFGGLRFFELVENVGFLFEAGVRNHFHLLSDGQFNGVYGHLGAVFTF